MWWNKELKEINRLRNEPSLSHLEDNLKRRESNIKTQRNVWMIFIIIMLIALINHYK